MEWSEGEITVFDDSFETVYANEVVSYYFDSKYHDWWDATQCAELCKNFPDRFWEHLVDKLRHPAILGWAAEHFESDSQNLAVMFLHNCVRIIPLCTYVGPEGRDDTPQPRHSTPGPDPRAEEDDVHAGGAERVHELLTFDS